MADPQRTKAYAWESLFKTFYTHTTNRRELRQLIRRAERRYRVPPTQIRFLNRKHRARHEAKIQSAYDPEDHSIVLGWKDHNHAIALHEAAHAITDYLLGTHLQPHGKHWLGIYFWLLDWAGVVPHSALRASAKAIGLRWESVEKVAPGAIRRNYERLIAAAEDDRE